MYFSKFIPINRELVKVFPSVSKINNYFDRKEGKLQVTMIASYYDIK